MKTTSSTVGHGNGTPTCAEGETPKSCTPWLVACPTVAAGVVLQTYRLSPKIQHTTMLSVRTSVPARDGSMVRPFLSTCEFSGAPNK